MPVAVQVAGVGVKEQHPGEVRPVGGPHGRIEVEVAGQQEVSEPVPAQDFIVSAEDGGEPCMAFRSRMVPGLA